MCGTVDIICSQGLRIEYNIFCESFHNILKNEYLKRLSNHRLDFLIKCLLNYDFSRARTLYLSLYSDNKEFLGSRQLIALKRHDKGVSLKDRYFKEKEGIYYYKNYIIRPDSCRNCNEGCLDLCKKCRVCKDRYICNCLSRCKRKEMCKHVHKVHSLLNNKGNIDTSREISSRNKMVNYGNSPIDYTPFINYRIQNDKHIVSNDINSNTINSSINYNKERFCNRDDYYEEDYINNNYELNDIHKQNFSNAFNLDEEEIKYTGSNDIPSTTKFFNEITNRTDTAQIIKDTNTFPNNKRLINNKKKLIYDNIDKIKEIVFNTESVFHLDKIEKVTDFLKSIRDISIKDLGNNTVMKNKDMFKKPIRQRKNTNIRKGKK